MEKTEVEKFAERFEADGLVGFHVSWGLEGEKLSAEEKARVLNRIIDEHKADMANTIPVPVKELTDIAEALGELSRLGRAPIGEWLHMPPGEQALRRRIRELSEFPAIFARQALERQPSDPA